MSTNKSNKFYKFMPLAPYTRLSLFMLLKHKALFCAHTDILNDPTDCNPHFHVNLPDEEIKSEIEDLSKNYKNTEIRSYAKTLSDAFCLNNDSSPEKEADYERAKSIFGGNLYPCLMLKKYTKEAGVELLKRRMKDETNRTLVFSMSKTLEEPRLWAHYADSHKGICIELGGLEKLKDNVISDKVEYTTKRPSILYSDIKNITEKTDSSKKNQMYNQMFFQKSIGWKHEQEHRLVIQNSNIESCKVELNLPEGNYIVFDKVKLKSITFGINTSTEGFNLIKDILKTLDDKKQPPCYHMSQVEDAYNLTKIDFDLSKYG